MKRVDLDYVASIHLPTSALDIKHEWESMIYELRLLRRLQNAIESKLYGECTFKMVTRALDALEEVQ